MSKTISEDVKKKFAKFAIERHSNKELCGAFGVDDLFDAIGVEYRESWKFAPENDKYFDFYELFRSLPDGFVVEEHGYDDFYVVHEGDECDDTDLEGTGWDVSWTVSDIQSRSVKFD